LNLDKNFFSTARTDGPIGFGTDGTTRSWEWRFRRSSLLHLLTSFLIFGSTEEGKKQKGFGFGNLVARQTQHKKNPQRS
jgi:hypothetical protein